MCVSGVPGKRASGEVSRCGTGSRLERVAGERLPEEMMQMLTQMNGPRGSLCLDRSKRGGDPIISCDNIEAGILCGDHDVSTRQLQRGQTVVASSQ